MRWRWSMVLLWLLVPCAQGAGPRWVAGPRWTNQGWIMNWYRADVQYFVDAGPLSASVDHAAAVALVDAAAGVWNVPTVPFTLTNGGSLSEDVSSGNVYLGSNGPVWPADVQSANYTGKQIAVVLDADGSITDMLLGAGASDPANCRQSAVTESVDLFIQPGKIAHALLVLNGRCTGAAAEQQMQLRYQLMRAFGRVIGLGWSQTNDNVFTGIPSATPAQQLHWPVMHPMDILCGPYTYQCMLQPFVLRDDDVAALRLVMWPGGQLPKDTIRFNGSLQFASGEGMPGLNVAVRRGYRWTDYMDGFEDVSGVTGAGWQADIGNPVTGGPVDVSGTGGHPNRRAGELVVFGIPALTQFAFTDLVVTSGPVNPLYTGAYAVGPYRGSHVAPSGSFSYEHGYVGNGGDPWTGEVRVAGAAGGCNTAGDGSESVPAVIPVEGVWSGLFCGVGHAAWKSFAVKAKRTATLEVTATDEARLATSSKARPVIGIWHGADALGTLPTLAATPGAMNSSRVGMTQLRVSFAVAERLRIAIADQRGDGRPDYTYTARLLYADTVMPARMPAEGGAIRIVGMGFVRGMTVTVGGVLAQVTSVSATEIDALAPTAAALHSAAVNDVVVTDPTTHGSTSVLGGLVYDGASTDALSMTVAPPASVPVSVPAAFAFKVVDASGSAVANAAVMVRVSGGGALVGACGLLQCTLVTDASGVVAGSSIASAAGTVGMTASIRSGASVTAAWTVVAASQAVGFVRPVQYVAAGAGVAFTPRVAVTSGGSAVPGQAVAWSTASGRIALGTGSSVSGSDGVAQMPAVASLREGEVATLQACAWATVCAVQSLVGVAEELRVLVTAGDAQSVVAGGTLGDVALRVTDAAGHPVAGAAVTVYQVVTGWQPPCAVRGRCASAPVYGKSSVVVTSNEDGNVAVGVLQYADTAAVTKLTATVGLLGSVTVVLQKTP